MREATPKGGGFFCFIFPIEHWRFSSKKSLLHVTARDFLMVYAAVILTLARHSLVLQNGLSALLQILHRLMIILAGNSQIQNINHVKLCNP